MVSYTKNELYNSFFQQGNDIFFLHLTTDNLELDCFLEVNEAACFNLEYTPDEFLKMKFFDIIAQPKQKSFIKNLNIFYEKKEIIFESEMISKTGKIIPVEINLKYININNQKLIISVVRIAAERKRYEEALNFRMELNWIITSISSRFINLVASEIDKGINDALRIIGKFVKADRSFVFTFSENKLTISNSHEWCDEGINSHFDKLKYLDVSNYPYLINNIKNKPYFFIDNVMSLPDEAKNEKDFLLAQQIKSLVVVPMTLSKEFRGFIGFASVHEKNIWNEDAVALLQFAGEIIINASERKSIEDALFKSENKYRMLVENLQEGILVINNENNIVFINNAMCFILGLLQKEIINTPFLNYIHEKSIKSALYYINRQKLGIKEQFDLELKRKDNSSVFVAIASSPFFDDNEIFTGSLCAVVDITERKLAQQMLTRRLKYEKCLAQCSKNLLANAMDVKNIHFALQELLSVAGASRVYIFENVPNEQLGLCMSQKYEAVAEGISPEIDNPALQLIPYGYGFNRWEENLSMGIPIKGLIRDFPKTEREILEPQSILSILVLPIFIKGFWYGFIGFDETLNERIWNEDEIILLGTASEMVGSFIDYKNSENKMNLIVKNLEADLLKSKNLNKLKSEFLSLITDDLKDILSMKRNHPDGLTLDNTLSFGVNLNSESSNTDSQGLMNYIEKIMELSLIEITEKDTLLHPFNLEELVNDIFSMYQPKLIQNKASYELFFDSDNVIISDKTKVHQILLVLIGTALKFSYNGKISIKFFQKDYRYHLDIFCDGIVLSDVSIMDIISLYQKDKSFSHHASHRLAAGFSISKNLINLLNGAITVSSKSDTSYQLSLIIPVPDKNLITDESDDQNLVEKNITKTIYFAEDDNTFFRLLEKILQENPAYRIKGFTNGSLLINELKKSQKCDLIILDIQMPIMDGMETLSEVKKLNENIPVIALSAYAMKDDINKFANQGFADYITKPINKTILLKIIHKNIGI